MLCWILLILLDLKQTLNFSYDTLYFLTTSIWGLEYPGSRELDVFDLFLMELLHGLNLSVELLKLVQLLVVFLKQSDQLLVNIILVL